MKTESRRRVARAITDGDTILSTLEVAAPPEAIFRALTTEEIERWWGSAETYHLTAWTADFRVGGRWQVTVRGADGKSVPVGGKYLEIDAPRKLVYTRDYERDHPTMGGVVTTITIRLDAVESGTRVTVRHDGFAGRREPADEHADGWESVLGWLEAYVRSGAARWDPRSVKSERESMRGSDPTKWITREDAKVDRIACPWLIRRFVDKDAEFLFVSEDRVLTVARREGAIPYDVPGAELGHRDGRCSFESIMVKYGLTEDPGLNELARIVHAADVDADIATSPEGPGLQAVAKGFSILHGRDDHRKIALESPIYDALYAWCLKKARRKAA